MHGALTFSESVGLQPSLEPEWFDPTLILDAPLCVDPYLLSDLEHSDEFSGAHDEVVRFFNHQLDSLARVGGNPSSPTTRRVIANMHLPEVPELCLGYTAAGTDGLGSGTVLAKKMVAAMALAIAAGLKDVEHFEELAILGKGIGPDRISDATSNIIKWRLAEYTERVCEQLGLPVEDHVLEHARFDSGQERWVAVEAALPTNPHSGHPLLLVPKRFLRHLPTLGSDEFERFFSRRFRAEHKEEFNKKLLGKRDLERAVEEARSNKRRRDEFIAASQAIASTPYDFESDPWGLVAWEQPVRDYVGENPQTLEQPMDAESLQAFVRDLVAYFKHFVEEQRGWDLLWNDDGQPRRESAAQRVFLGISFLSCRDQDIDITPEANMGRGPVDFKFSKGFAAKVLVETKLAKNTRWLKGVTAQLPAYKKSEQCSLSEFVLIKHNDIHDQKILDLQKAAESAQQRGLDIGVTIVDASRDKPSASKL